MVKNTLDIKYIKPKLHPFYQVMDVVESIDSTHHHIKQHLSNFKVGDVLLAREQVSGIGTFGRSFFSPKDKGVYCSFCVDSKPLPWVSTLMPIVVGIAICDVLTTHYRINAKVQWVNDVLINNQKVAGVLCEHTEDIMIVSFGLNVYDTIYPASIKDCVTNLFSYEELININKLTVLLLNQIIAIINHVTLLQIQEAFIKYRNNNQVTIKRNNQNIQVDIVSIDEAGRLQVLDDQQQLITLYSSNEIIKD